MGADPAPEPEVAAAGHDRTIINIKPEHVDAWLNPRSELAAMQAILDDKRHPFYEHRMAHATVDIRLLPQNYVSGGGFKIGRISG